MKGPHLTPLTSVRFFAAAGVVLFHMHGWWGLPSSEITGLRLGIAVDLFFVLSGFILAYTYRELASRNDALRLIGYRIARIWPLHLVTLLLFYLLAYNPANPIHDPSKVWSSILLVQSWTGNYLYAFQGNSVAWTLSVELFFYLLFPLMVVMSRRNIVLLTALITAATLYWSSFHKGQVAFTDDVVSAAAILRMHPGSFFVLFAAGVLMGRTFVARDWHLTRTTATILEFLAICAAIAFLLWYVEIWQWAVRTLGITGHFALWFRIVLGALFFSPLIFVLAIGKGWFSDGLSWRPLVFLGEISFATYLVHPTVQTIFKTNGLATPKMIVVYVAALVLASWLLYRFVERPANTKARAWIDSWLRRDELARQN